MLGPQLWRACVVEAPLAFQLWRYDALATAEGAVAPFRSTVLNYTDWEGEPGKWLLPDAVQWCPSGACPRCSNIKSSPYSHAWCTKCTHGVRLASPLLPAVPPVRSAHVPDTSGQPNRAALPQLAPRPLPPAEVEGERQGADPTSGSTRPKATVSPYALQTWSDGVTQLWEHSREMPVLPQRPVIGAGKVRRPQSLT